MSPLYHEEISFLQTFKEKVLSDGEFSREELLEIAERFEEMIEMTSVTVKIIDRLMNNHDRIKRENSLGYASVKKG